METTQANAPQTEANAPAAAPEQGNEQAKNPLEAAIAAARERARDEQGRFKAEQEAGEAADLAVPAGADEANPDHAASTAEPAAEPTDETDTLEDDDAPEPIVVALPGRQPGEEVEYEVTDPEFAEELRRLRKGYMRREEFHQQMEVLKEDRDEVEYIRHALATDPSGFLLQQVPQEVRTQMVVETLTDPQVFRAVMQQIAPWAQNPAARDLAAAKLEAERYRRQEMLETTISESRAVQTNAEAIKGEVEGMIPEGADPAAAQAFFRDAIRDLSEYVTTNNIKRFPPEQVRAFLEQRGRTRLYGFQPVQPGTTAPAAAPVTAAPSTAPLRPSPTLAAPAAPAPQKLEQARNQGKQFKEASARRRTAAVAPAGAGAVTTNAQLPKNTGNIRDTIRAARGKLGW